MDSSSPTGCSSGDGSEGVAGGETAKGVVSSAEDKSIIPCAGTARGYRQELVVCTVRKAEGRNPSIVPIGRTECTWYESTL